MFIANDRGMRAGAAHVPPSESTAAIPTSGCKTALSAIFAQVSQSIFEMSAYAARVNRLTGRLRPRLSLRVRPELADLNLPRRRNSGTTNPVNSLSPLGAISGITWNPSAAY